MKRSTLLHPFKRMTPHPAFGDRGSGISPDEGVRRTDGQPVVPSQDIPEDRAQQAGQDHVEVDGLQPDHSFAHGPGDGGSEGEGGNKIEESRPEDGDTRRQHARGNHRGDGVRGIVEAIEEIEAEGDDHDDDCKCKRWGHFSWALEILD